MPGIVERKVETYLAGLDGRQDPVRAEMEALAQREDFPIVGPQVGRLLAILARGIRAERVLELGSGYGYSALWFARAMSDTGSVTCTDLSPENRDLAVSFFRKAGVEGRMRFHVGDALSLARTLAGPFDVVFNDIDKADYPQSVSVAVPLLRVGGLFITDNVLWSGKVAAGRRPDATTTAIREFNEIVSSRDDLETVILPLRDGVAVCQKVR